MLQYSSLLSIEYGFPLYSWLEYMLSSSIASENTLTSSVKEDFTEKSVDISTKWLFGKMARLFSNAARKIFSEFRNGSSESYIEIYCVYEIIDSSNVVQMVNDMQKTFCNKNITGGNSFNSQLRGSVEFSKCHLSPRIQFDADTVEPPVDMKLM